MISLLPYETKRQTHAARINIILVRYIVILGFSFIFIVVVCLGTYFFLNNNKSSAEETADKTPLSSVQVQADTIRSNLTMSKIILDQQGSYYDAITGIADNLPVGSIINSLSLNDSSFGSALNLKVLSSSDKNEQDIKEDFQKSTLFSGYKLISTAPNQAESTKTKYPFTINISVTINKGLAQ